MGCVPPTSVAVSGSAWGCLPRARCLPPCKSQTGVKTLPSPRLRLRAVLITVILIPIVFLKMDPLIKAKIHYVHNVFTLSTQKVNAESPRQTWNEMTKVPSATTKQQPRNSSISTYVLISSSHARNLHLTSSLCQGLNSRTLRCQ